MPKKALNISRALKKKGFLENTKRDHIWYTYYRNGKKTSINTKISHGVNEIDDGLLGKMARQMRLSRHDFDEFVACHLSQDDYDKQMLDNNQIIP